MIFFLLASFLAVGFSQYGNCTSGGEDFVDSSFTYGNAQYIVDVWSGSFILPLIIDDSSGSTACLVGDITGQSSIQFTCSSDGTTITREYWNSAGCSGTAQETYSWSQGSSPTLNVAQIQQGNIVYDSNSSYTLEIAQGSGNLFDFSCAGSYQAAEIKMGIACGNALVTVYGALGGGCLATDEAQGKLMVSCDNSGSYLYTFVDATSTGSTTEDNVCENDAANGRFVCEVYTASSSCSQLLVVESLGLPLYAEHVSCTTDSGDSDGGSAAINLLSVIFICMISFLLH